MILLESVLEGQGSKIAENKELKMEEKRAAAMALAVTGGVLLACLVLAAHPRLGTSQPQQQAVTNLPRAGEVKVNPKDGLKYVWIPPATFMMGCSPGDNECRSSEKPSHQVALTKGFWMGQTEVTVGAYERFASATGRQMPPDPDFNSGWANRNMPVVNVNWYEAQAYCRWSGGGLPTEAEWEYSARGGDPHVRYGDLDKIAWYEENVGRGTHEVAQKQANGFGLYDMLGNVGEWVNDWYDANYYQNSPSLDPMGPSSGQHRVLRGGSWAVNVRYVRVSDRLDNHPALRNLDGGLRCVGEANSG